MKGSVDVYPEPAGAKTMDVRVSRINYVLGIELSREEMVRMLEGLEIKVEGEGDIMRVTPPTVRQDLLEMTEESFQGVDIALFSAGNSEAGMPYERSLRDAAREALCGMGLNEIQTYSFVSPSGVDKIGIGEDSWERAFVRIINPLGEDTSVMRTVLTPNMMEVLARNYSRNLNDVRAFEIGNTFMDNPISRDNLPDEDYALCIGMYGQDVDFFTLKGIIEELLANLGITDVSFQAESEYGVYHPGRCARVLVEASDAMKMAGEEYEELGIMGEIHPDVAENYGMDGMRIYCCELMFGQIVRRADTEIVYTPLPKYPSTSRDIALLVYEDMEVGRIEKVIRERGGAILESVRLFDVYRGKQVEEGKKSVAFTLVYRDMNKTLTDQEVAEVHEGVLKALREELGAVLREM